MNLEKFLQTIGTKVKDNYILLLILFLAIVLRILYYSTSITFPGSNVVLEAMHMKEGIYDPNLIWHPMGIRYILLILTTLSISLFGISELSVYLPIFIASITNIILLYFITKKIYDKNIALLAAFLLAILPLDIYNATILESDILMSTFILAALLCYFCTQRYVVTGIFIALGFFTKIFAFAMLPLLCFYDLLGGGKRRENTYIEKLFPYDLRVYLDLHSNLSLSIFYYWSTIL